VIPVPPSTTPHRPFDISFAALDALVRSEPRPVFRVGFHSVRFKTPTCSFPRRSNFGAFVYAGPIVCDGIPHDESVLYADPQGHSITVHHGSTNCPYDLPVLISINPKQDLFSASIIDGIASAIEGAAKSPLFLHEVELAIDLVQPPWEGIQGLQESFIWKHRFKNVELHCLSTLVAGGRKSSFAMRIYDRGKKTGAPVPVHRVEFVFRFHGFKNGFPRLDTLVSTGLIQEKIFGNVVLLDTPLSALVESPELITTAQTRGAQGVWNGVDGLFSKKPKERKTFRTNVIEAHSSDPLVNSFESAIRSFLAN
jgi:hypothetical protein